MTGRSSRPELLSVHPCFTEGAGRRYGRMHIPCAPRCNLSCAFCGRGLDAGETWLPGRTESVVTPDRVREYVQERLAGHPEIRVLGIAGPGEPLFNPETLEVLKILGKDHPDMILCLGTNGFCLPEAAETLAELGVRTVTVTVNAARPETMLRLNDRILLTDGTALSGEDGAKELLSRQLEGIRRCADLDITVKVNTVLVPGINDSELMRIAEKVREAGASIQNLMPLQPAGRLKDHPAPSPAQLHQARRELEQILPQFRSCTQCRADACGLLTKQDIGTFPGCIK